MEHVFVTQTLQIIYWLLLRVKSKVVPLSLQNCGWDSGYKAIVMLFKFRPERSELYSTLRRVETFSPYFMKM